uniref:Uncharacterized protein n=1 Tax=Anopheles arabiensis TaxID=7173 RepID=A0A182IGP4_ANOAR
MIRNPVCVPSVQSCIILFILCSRYTSFHHHWTLSSERGYKHKNDLE